MNARNFLSGAFRVPERPVDASPLRAPIDAQHLWFELARQDWRTLVLVPAGTKVSPIHLGHELARIGGAAEGDRVLLIDATGDKVDDAPCEAIGDYDLIRTAETRWNQRAVARRMRHIEDYVRALVVVSSPVTNPSALTPIRQADATLLCVHLGHASVDGARRTVELLDRDNLLGSVAVTPAGPRGAPVQASLDREPDPLDATLDVDPLGEVTDATPVPVSRLRRDLLDDTLDIPRARPTDDIAEPTAVVRRPYGRDAA